MKFKSKHEDEENTVLDYYMVLAPFQKQTQVEFSNIKIKETAIRFLTVANLFDKPRQVNIYIIRFFFLLVLLFKFNFYSLSYLIQMMVYSLMFMSSPYNQIHNVNYQLLGNHLYMETCEN